MKFGYMSLNTAAGITPSDLGREIEQRGYDSLWMPEHTHIPLEGLSNYPGGGELPDGYKHMMNPFVALSSAAAAAENIKLVTGICLVLQHDLLDLACSVATLDQLSEGRVLFGVGVGWNEAELANHRPDLPFRQRYLAMKECVEALRCIWREDTPEFSGRWHSFKEAWVYPKPYQNPLPIALGNAGKLGIKHAAEYADHWCPMDAQLRSENGRPDVGGAIKLFRRLATESGRNPDEIPISIVALGNLDLDRLKTYSDFGVSRIVLPPATFVQHDADTTLRWLDECQVILDAMSDYG
ncbi:MAG: TIGR03619 family F420-dependent LLM class oxidoreductase [Pseudomonadales bacterium]